LARRFGTRVPLGRSSGENKGEVMGYAPPAMESPYTKFQVNLKVKRNEDR
jgi:hypothetical protein